MANGKQRFILKVAVIMLAFIAFFTFAGVSVEDTTNRFGKLGWLPWLLGLFSLIAGLIVAWGSAISFFDWRALRRYQVNPDDTFNDGQTVALSGQVRVDGQPLMAPFSGKPCACFSYQINGQRRGTGSSTNDYRQQLCVLGYQLAPAALHCNSRRFPLQAIADVDTDLRSTAMGGDWGDRGLERIRSAPDNMPHAEEADARGALGDAQTCTSAPHAANFFIASTQTGANQITVHEDIVPVDTAVTILAAYTADKQGLNGRRSGGMKVFMGDLNESLGGLRKEWRKGLQIAPPLLVIGTALITLAWWWPA